MSTCGVCVQPFDFMSSENARGHDLCVLQEERANFLKDVDAAEQIANTAVEDYDRLEEEVNGLKRELSETLAELAIAKDSTENIAIKEETELC